MTDFAKLQAAITTAEAAGCTLGVTAIAPNGTSFSHNGTRRFVAASTMKIPITGVVPQPGTTLPYSEFRGRSRSPRRVRWAMVGESSLARVAASYSKGLGPDLRGPLSALCRDS